MSELSYEFINLNQTKPLAPCLEDHVKPSIPSIVIGAGFRSEIKKVVHRRGGSRRRRDVIGRRCELRPTAPVGGARRRPRAAAGVNQLAASPLGRTKPVFTCLYNRLVSYCGFDPNEYASIRLAYIVLTQFIEISYRTGQTQKINSSTVLGWSCSGVRRRGARGDVCAPGHAGSRRYSLTALQRPLGPASGNNI
ncbi:hypothetical protein EVAR_9043_1 [Eumeta japonica]|uniref:Uncharacterized protein n=1 Tax=Eumeta variegata TaxID=151549 RepID=A0A4C1TVZ3_EUMVA|nr:hypothetical protein EVAR_9043_1 [Eumeta japonica]